MKIKEGKLEKMGMAKNNPRGFERQKSDLKKTFDARILYEICWEFGMGISLIIAFMMTMRNQIIKRQNLWTGKALCGKLLLIIILVHLIIQIKIL